MLKDLPRLSPSRPAQPQKCIQGILRKHVLAFKLRRAKMTKLFQHGNIDNQIADRHAYARLSILWLENAEGKILQWKMRIFCDLDERAKSHAYDLTTKITEEHEELFQIFFFKQLRDLRVLRGN